MKPGKILLVTITSMLGLILVITIVCISNIHMVYNHDAGYTHRQVVTKPIEEYHNDPFYYDTYVDAKTEALSFSCVNLKFAHKNDIKNGKANCVGYAQYASDVFNDVAIQKGFKERAKSVVGQYYIFDINLHKFISRFISDPKLKAFIKDHHYVRIYDEKGNVLDTFDPSVSDALGLLDMFVSIEEK